jgi:NADH-quinone oxidoreductase subunit N
MNLVLAHIGVPFIPSLEQLAPFAPDLVLIGTIVAVLLAPFYKRSNMVSAGVALVGLGLAFLSLFVVGLGEGMVGLHFRGMLINDHFAVIWKGLLLLFTMGIIVMWFATTSRSMHEGDGPEFFTLLLGATLGMSLMASTTNLLMIVIAVELASLPSYLLAGFRKTNRIAAEASLKYVLFGAATAAIMVYGLSLLYGLYGTLQLEELAAVIGAGTEGSVTTGGAVLAVAIFGLLVGIGFKISAVPFHFWCPDVFEGAHIDVSAFLSVASKGAALVLLLRVLMVIAEGVGFQNVPGLSLTALAAVIGILGAITATVGNTAALVQTNIKRLLAYSSIAHAGYMMCALSLLVPHSRPLVAELGGQLYAISAAQALLLYLAVYLFMNLGAFTVAGLIYRQTGSEQIADYAALGSRAPILAVCMTAFMFSLVGLPPLAGFMAKLNLMVVLFENQGWWIGLVVVIGVNTIFSLYYYVRVVKVMYLDESEAPAVPVGPVGTALAGACAVILVAMLVGFQPVSRVTEHFGRMHLAGGAAAAELAEAGNDGPTAMAE